MADKTTRMPKREWREPKACHSRRAGFGPKPIRNPNSAIRNG
jgi:hypothetical protein